VTAARSPGRYWHTNISGLIRFDLVSTPSEDSRLLKITAPRTPFRADYFL